MNETMTAGQEVEEGVSLEDFRKEIEDLKIIDSDPLLNNVNPKELGWPELEVWSYLKRTENPNSSEEEIEGIKNKFKEITLRSEEKNKSQLLFFKYLENRFKK